MIVLDASVLIAHFETADVHHARAGALLLEHAEHEFWANTVTLAEFLVGPTRQGTVAAARQGIADLEITAHGVGEDDWITLADLRVNTGCKMPDCCVLYTAERHHAAIATFDDTLVKRAKSIGLTVAATAG